MCQFLSTVKTKDKNGKDKYLFLTYDLIHNTPRGELLQKKYGGDDLIGHSAIREYFEVRSGQGEDVEYTDFSTPKNFPAIIAKAIKRGEFLGFGQPKGLLTQPAYAEYEKITQQAYAEYQKITQPAYAEYQKIRQPAYAEYEKITQQAYAEYQKIRQPAKAEYEKIRQQAYAEYEKIRQQAYAEYEKITQQAEAEYQKIRQPAFWDLFADPKNRAEAWR
jgi:F0F1-type ATP synthase membrane subunit b/b'